MIRQFLLGFGLLIMVGGFLLIWDSPPKSFMRQQQGQVEKVPSADSYMIAVTSRRFSKTGGEQLIISSPKIELYTGDSKVLMSQPSILSIDQQTGANAVAQLCVLFTLVVMGVAGEACSPKPTSARPAAGRDLSWRRGDAS